MSALANTPLSIMIESAKGILVESFNQVQEKTNLPAYLLEGVILDLLSQIRNQKNLELISDMNRMNQETEKEDGKEGEE